MCYVRLIHAKRDRKAQNTSLERDDRKKRDHASCFSWPIFYRYSMTRLRRSRRKTAMVNSCSRTSSITEKRVRRMSRRRKDFRDAARRHVLQHFFISGDSTWPRRLLYSYSFTFIYNLFCCLNIRSEWFSTRRKIYERIEIKICFSCQILQ